MVPWRLHNTWEQSCDWESQHCISCNTSHLFSYDK